MNLEEMLIKHEGYHSKLYMDSKGIPTIGVGHNLRAKALSDAAIRQILADDIADARQDADTLPWFGALDPVRQNVVLDMLFNMGLEKFNEFKQTQSYIASGNYAQAADEMLNSLWAKEVGLRASELSQMMRTGVA